MVYDPSLETLAKKVIVKKWCVENVMHDYHQELHNVERKNADILI